MPSDSTPLTVAFLYSLPSMVLKSSASALDAKQPIHIIRAVFIFWGEAFMSFKIAASKLIRAPKTRSAYHRPAPVPAAKHMIDCPRILDAQRSGHRAKECPQSKCVSILGSDPFSLTLFPLFLPFPFSFSLTPFPF